MSEKRVEGKKASFRALITVFLFAEMRVWLAATSFWVRNSIPQG